MRKLAIGTTWVALVATAACNDALDVANRNSPDVNRALSSPAAVEQIVSTLYQGIHTGLHGSSTSLSPQMAVMSFASYGTVANFGMGTRAGIPRSQIDNKRNNITDAENLRDFSFMSRRSRDAADAVQALDKLAAQGKVVGNPGAADNNVGLNKRVRSFALFCDGLALGYLALSYDSAAIVTHQSKPASEETPPLSDYNAVMTAAIALLDSAEAQATGAAAAPGFPLPNTSGAYLNGQALTQDQYIRVIRSFRARFRAGVARTPAERAAVDWTKVIADATNGIQANLVIQLQAGYAASWDTRQIYQDDSRGWHQMPLMIYGMADTSGTYDAFIAAPLGQRNGQAPNMIIRTPDRRFPRGDTRAQQQANSLPNAANTGFVYPYIRNRSGQDTPSADAWATSFYDFYRFKNIDLNNGSGPWPEMMKVEMDMLAAEGYIRQNNFAAATTLINASRANAGLAPIGTITSATQAIQGGAANCVPRVPVGPNYTTTACGNIMEAMKWEKRMETAFTGYGQWYFDARGWGDLPEGTALNWPVPNEELDARSKPLYNLGGVGGPASAAKGTYGF